MPAKERKYTSTDEINYVKGLGTFRLSRVELSPYEKRQWLIQYINAHKDSPHDYHQAAVEYAREVLDNGHIQPSTPIKPTKQPSKKAEFIGPGECHCGCGKKTKSARITDKKKGWIKGEPLKYLHGHSGNHKVK